ncbi:uncharacterized protein KY384_008753 [Bacidia gigantensis]|uniref:uncharacterized protein n=1 Tax=Bacidia gigantensis TaxID=2732470 RepID=UPI001D05BE6D|nr:uncharacterized protein KY384_008753 [Bacidia gigantensis]KAG8526552.1 hypothetical protein KY384_008753 [Bacidia gigantensis]
MSSRLSDNSIIARKSTREEGYGERTDSDEYEEREAVRKVDLHILPMVFLYYLFSFLDRSNIGNGRLYGLEKDLGMRGNQFQTASSLFFVTYVASEIPSTIWLRTLRPARFINAIAVAWGIIATLTGLTQNYGGFIVCRLLLGAAEGPLFPCLVVYMISFYTRQELAVRFGYLISGAAMAGAVGGLIAYGVGYMDKLHEMRAWRWLLILEGLPSICLGVFGWFFLADGPESAWYLTPAQRGIVVRRRVRDQREASTASAQSLNKADIIAAFKDWKVWAFCVENFGGDIQLFSYSIFLPTIIQSINPDWSTLVVQALTVPCFVWCTVVYFAAAFVSDRIQHRASFILFGFTMSIIGHIMLIAGKSVAVLYLACYVIATGLFILGIALAWLPSNLPRYGKRSAGVAMQIALGNSAGIPAPYVRIFQLCIIYECAYKYSYILAPMGHASYWDMLSLLHSLG